MTDACELVLFASSFRRDGSPNITHAAICGGTYTLCGRAGWVVAEKWHPGGPDCLRCRKALEALSPEARA